MKQILSFLIFWFKEAKKAKNDSSFQASHKAFSRFPDFEKLFTKKRFPSLKTKPPLFHRQIINYFTSYRKNITAFLKTNGLAFLC